MQDTQLTVSTMARRGSGGGANNDEISLTLAVCNSQLEQLAKRVHNNCKDFPKDRVLSWKHEILALSQQADVAKNTANYARVVLIEERSKAAPNNVDEPDSAPNALTRLKQTIIDMTSDYDGSNADTVRKLSGIMKLGADEEEVELMDQELHDQNFNCPYTTIRIVEPMKNGICIHRVSKIAIPAVVKKGKCFVPGCSATWTSSNAKPDPEYQTLMEEYFASKAQKKN